MLTAFWDWYERNYKLNLFAAAGLFVWQLVHLYWLSLNVVALRIFGVSYFDVSGLWEYAIIFVDYTEIPALISVSLLYINELRKQFNWKSAWFLFFLNSQWFHLFWITDEFIVSQLAGMSAVVLPLWLVWMAIAIDYLELPVIYDTIKKSAFCFVRSSGTTTND